MLYMFVRLQHPATSQALNRCLLNESFATTKHVNCPLLQVGDSHSILNPYRVLVTRPDKGIRIVTVPKMWSL